MAKRPVKCPHCGSRKFGLMPADFETAKCSKCGKSFDTKGAFAPKESSMAKAGLWSRLLGLVGPKASAPHVARTLLGDVKPPAAQRDEFDPVTPDPLSTGGALLKCFSARHRIRADGSIELEVSND